MLAELGELGDHHLFDTIVRQTVRLGEAPLAGKPVTSYASRSGAAEAYRKLAQEVIDLG
jgi:chromosome partitioning protein